MSNGRMSPRRDLLANSWECSNEMWNYDRRYAVKGLGVKPLSLRKIGRPYKLISKRCNNAIMDLLLGVKGKDTPAYYDTIGSVGEWQTPDWDDLQDVSHACGDEWQNYAVGQLQ